ncbi:hypothetical protein AYJ57_18465 [Salipiger sp. CCB-MM3]|uniref:glycosyltransferase n=1 Tax=Salipiger sp. CCB-MM3 TaxID=1792508 RepID=UPI00080AABC9|nr:glycosyltransferase [Salipiger sp. CCB-MM3]ANT62393.1 hypothetical protein AYJ57_18465 [Salipiger sp. CCB-MM3]
MTFFSAIAASHPDRPRVVHLVDDTTAGGVMRYLEFLRCDATLAAEAEHVLLPVARGAVGRLSLPAGIIVSHLSINWRALPGLIALRARHPSARLIHVEHSYTASFAALNVPSRARFFTLLRSAYALFDKVVAVSAAQGDWLRTRRLVPWERLAVIRPVVDLSAFAALPAPRGQGRVIGAFGRLDRQKGFDTLISAFRAVPDADKALHIYGAGDDLAALQAQAGGDPRIRFLGHVADPARAMAEVDVVAMPSRWEAYGIAALEARVAGRPLITSGADGLRDHAGAGVTQVSPAALTELTEALRGGHAPGLPPSARQVLAAGSEHAVRRGWSELLGLAAPDVGTAPEEVAALA